MITAAFARSQVVYLKSGGPGMTVERVTPCSDPRGPLLDCSWFEGKRLRSKTFFADLVTPTNPKAAPIVPPPWNETEKDRE